MRKRSFTTEEQDGSRCPSALQLERYVLSPGLAPAADHVAGCARCQATVEAMEADGETFLREVYPDTVRTVLAPVTRGQERRRWRRVAFAALVLIPALAVLLLLRPRPGYVGAKGSGLGLTVFVQADGGAHAAADGDVVGAAAAVRFHVRPARACNLWMVSVDAAGGVSRLHPASGDGGAELRGPATLPGGALLDGRPGPERIYAVCTPGPLPFEDVERAARRAAGGGEAAVRAAVALRGLPRGAEQATLLLEKRL